MIIEKIVLENIRSYTNQTVEFRTGSVLLSGDIGSGKSSILLSIEFVLFGFRRLDLSGNTLLRHGEKQGSVELHFRLGKKQIIVKRTLKRGPGGVKQDKGYMVIDGVKEDLTAIEIKSRIIELFGYPLELLSKSRESIYRYTVYTPQEAMKHIIFADTQERLDILRRVFGIDKYKRIKENNLIYSRELKNRLRFISGQIEDLPRLIDERMELKENKVKITKEAKEYEKIFLSIKEDIEKRKKRIEIFEIKEKALEKKKNENKILDIKAQQLKKEIELSDQRIKIHSKALESDKKEVSAFKDIDEEKIKEFLKEINARIEEADKKRSEMLQKKAVLRSDDKKSNELLQSVLSLNDCPTCRQSVQESHKKSIKLDTHKILEENSSRIKKIDGLVIKIEKNLGLLKTKKEDVNKKLSQVEKKKVLVESIEEKKKEMDRLRIVIDENSKKLVQISRSQEELHESIEALKEELQDYPKQKSDLNQINEKYQMSAMDFSKAKQKLEDTVSRLDLLDKKIDEKKSLKNKLQKKKSLLSIFENSMTPLVSLMEKQVMGTIHYEFNQVLSKWFNLLMEEDMLSIRIDEEFNPLIEQNGYETQIDNLSGGEKTAVALSYRLALNRVINDVVSNIRTKDLLILDEPTDGFSNEELSKLNDVLHELNVKQLIIVSHDNQIEGFVDNHIRIQKQEHESIVMN